MTEHDDELTALTQRLEQAEAEAARLLASLREERMQRADIARALGLDGAPSLDEVVREIERLKDGRDDPALHPLDKAHMALAWGRVCDALGIPKFDERHAGAVLSMIEQLKRAAERSPDPDPDDSPALDLVALPRPEDLPSGYLFRVVRWALEQVDGVADLCEQVCGGKP